MESRMNARSLAKRLRDRMAVLKKDRKRDLAGYEREFDAWKKAMGVWLKTGPQKNLPRVTSKCFENRHYGWDLGLPSWVFEGHPVAPKKPSDKAILSVRKTLRYLAFTGTPTVMVSQRQLDEWFGEGEDE